MSSVNGVPPDRRRVNGNIPSSLERRKICFLGLFREILIAWGKVKVRDHSCRSPGSELQNTQTDDSVQSVQSEVVLMRIRHAKCDPSRDSGDGNHSAVWTYHI